MQSDLQTNVTNQSIQPISPIDPQPIIEQGESPTAIILAIALLISIVIGSITGLVRVMAIVFLHQAQSQSRAQLPGNPK